MQGLGCRVWGAGGPPIPPGVPRAALAPALAGLFIPHRRAKPAAPTPHSLRGPSWGWGSAGHLPAHPKTCREGSPPIPLQVPGDHPHPHDGPPGIQIPVGATGRKGDLQERCAERCGEGEAMLGGHLWVFWGAPGLNLMPPPPFFSHSDTRQGPHILVKPVQRGRGHPLTPQNKGTPLVCSPPISMLSAWLYKV